MKLKMNQILTLQQVQSGWTSHLQDCNNIHFDTIEAQTASLQADTPVVIITMFNRNNNNELNMGRTATRKILEGPRILIMCRWF